MTKAGRRPAFLVGIADHLLREEVVQVIRHLDQPDQEGGECPEDDGHDDPRDRGQDGIETLHQVSFLRRSGLRVGTTGWNDGVSIIDVQVGAGDRSSCSGRT